MPVSRTSKAGLVAMVLIILTAVPRLDAAPMYPSNAWVQDLTKQVESATGLRSRRLDLDLNHPPPVEDDGPYDSAGQSYLAPYAQSAGTPHWQTPDNQKSGLGTSTRTEGRAASLSGGPNTAMPVEDPTRYAAALRERLAGPPLSDIEIFKILKGEPWRGLSPKQKSEFLNLFGETTFTLRNYLDSSFALERWKAFHDFAQTLVEEYLKVRFETRLPDGLLTFRWSGEEPDAEGFRQYARTTLRTMTPAGKVTTERAADSFDAKDPFKAIPLGEFYVQAFRARPSSGENGAWSSLRHKEATSVKVVAFAAKEEKMIYIGKATMWLGPEPGAEPM